MVSPKSFVFLVFLEFFCFFLVSLRGCLVFWFRAFKNQKKLKGKDVFLIKKPKKPRKSWFLQVWNQKTKDPLEETKKNQKNSRKTKKPKLLGETILSLSKDVFLVFWFQNQWFSVVFIGLEWFNYNMCVYWLCGNGLVSENVSFGQWSASPSNIFKQTRFEFNSRQCSCNEKVRHMKPDLVIEILEATSKLHPFILWIGRPFFLLLARFSWNQTFEDTWLNQPSINEFSLANLQQWFIIWPPGVLACGRHVVLIHTYCRHRMCRWKSFIHVGYNYDTPKSSEGSNTCAKFWPGIQRMQFQTQSVECWHASKMKIANEGYAVWGPHLLVW